jgi:poly(hydroxyalkanoate) depolymerase family esterase
MAKPSLLRIATFGLVIVACSSGKSSAPALSPSGAAKAPPPAVGTGAVAGGGALEEVSAFGDNPASLKMYVHAPAGKTPSAVVLALHGCGQTAADYVNAGWNDVGDREGLVIVYGEQTAANNSLRCFRWFDPPQIGKEGEAKSLASMVTAAHAKYGTKRAFVTGLSAGGAMTSVMLAAYPELFEAGAVMSGIPYKCATSPVEALACMKVKSQSADAWAALVPKMSTGPAPRVSIWQGEADNVVRPANREELVKQWAKFNGVAETPGETKTEGGATHALHKDASGVVRVESWSISNMGHGVALDPKSGCGKAGAYALDVGLCSTERAATFFLGTSHLIAGPTR